MELIIRLINAIIDIITLALIVYTLLQFILKPYSPILKVFKQIFEPFLTPIRNKLPPMAGLDFSPLVLFILLQILGKLLVALLRSF